MLVLACVAFWRGYKIHTGGMVFTAYGLGVLALGLAVWHLTRKPALPRVDKWDLFLPFFSPCSPERSDTQIEEQQHHSGSDQEHVVIGSMGPACPHAPQVGRKGDYWE